MQQLPLVDPKPSSAAWRPRLPQWLKRPLPRGNFNALTTRVLRELRLETVCENARCPNRPECYARLTATFMILGNVCTRPCSFCSVQRGKPAPPEPDEPERVAEAAARLGLKHVVITSVTRDDLPDGGASHFAAVIRSVRRRTGATIEVLIPDFRGDWHALRTVLDARPEVLNHNVETVPRLYDRVRRNADYRRSLRLLQLSKELAPEVATKSGLMVGLGETWDELLEVFADLRAVGCDILTVGQYLQPAPERMPVVRYVTPKEFEELERLARKFGFRAVACGPFVRSSYQAEEVIAAVRSTAASTRNRQPISPDAREHA